MYTHTHALVIMILIMLVIIMLISKVNASAQKFAGLTEHIEETHRRRRLTRQAPTAFLARRFGMFVGLIRSEAGSRFQGVRHTATSGRAGEIGGRCAGSSSSINKYYNQEIINNNT